MVGFMKTITKADLSKNVQDRIGLSQAFSEEIVSTIFNNIQNILNEEGVFKITNFGTFAVKQKAARPGINFSTMKSVTIKERKVVNFHPSRNLITELNNG